MTYELGTVVERAGTNGPGVMANDKIADRWRQREEDVLPCGHPKEGKVAVKDYEITVKKVCIYGSFR